MPSHGKHRAHPAAGHDAASIGSPVALEGAEHAFRLAQEPASASEAANRVTYPLIHARKEAMP